MKGPLRPEASLYRRNAAHITTREVLHELEKSALVADVPRLRRKKVQATMEARWAREEKLALDEGLEGVSALRSAIDELKGSFDALASVKLPELLGKVESEQQRLKNARNRLDDATAALRLHDFGGAGAAVHEVERELWLVGGPLVVVLNQALGQAAIGKEQRDQLRSNLAKRQAAKSQLESHRARDGAPGAIAAAADVHRLEAEGYQLAAAVLASQIRADAGRRAKKDVGSGIRVVPPQELETFEDVGGLEDVKQQLRLTVGAILERPEDAARYRVVHNGILFHGPPGTGKTLLSRALAGEYGMRYIRFSPASIASAYVHQAAANLQKLFELARDSRPCVLFLDEVDTVASARDDEPSADHREVVTQLMNALEEYRSVPGLVICAATNNIDRLDPGLREGRFDSKILVPLPDPQARADIVRVQLKHRDEAVDWDSIDLDEIARLTGGRNAAALESFVSIAAQSALRDNATIDNASLVAAIKEREGKDRLSLDQPVRWDDVVLDEQTQEQIMEIVNVFAHPELASSLGVRPPAGILLYGPPGTGKTTIAKAMATEISASFYEQSAADLLSKWAGESEERVAKLFTKAHSNRPAIIFIDEIDGLLRRRTSDSSSPWEQRVVSQFLRELDGLKGGDGVMLVGATNRLDIIDSAIQGRRLTPIEVGLPDTVGRLKLLRVLCRDVTLAKGVDLKSLAMSTEGMSGADLKRMRDAAGMKALKRLTSGSKSPKKVSITMGDLTAALEAQRSRASLVEV